MIIAALFFAATIQNAKPAWEWTLDERLAERFDPANIQERNDAYVERFPQLRGRPEPPLTGGVRYRIDGSRNPELFLPHELFDILVKDGLSSDPSIAAKSRLRLAGRLRSAGFDPETFWPALESVSAPYLVWTNKRSLQGRETDERCLARYEALQAARSVFGRQAFDRMLYSVIAPGAQFGAGTSMGNPADFLRREANGCQDPLPRPLVTPPKPLPASPPR
ncbi:MAG TPA: hypothetical protein VL284_09730 [Thermoanaerobaculia bacterium]|nr:hypothetical protein [Thermoanaerobaculia bacterium]